MLLDKNDTPCKINKSLLVLILSFVALSGCSKKEKEPVISAIPDSLYNKYEIEAIYIMPSEVLDTAKVNILLNKPENKGKVFTNFKGGFALVTPIKWDGTSKILDDIVYDMTEEQLLKVQEEELQEFKKDPRYASLIPPLTSSLEDDKSRVMSNKTIANKIIAYKRSRKGGGCTIITLER